MIEQGQIRKWKQKIVGREMYFTVIEIQAGKYLPNTVATIRHLKYGVMDSFFVSALEEYSKLVELTDDREFSVLVSNHENQSQ